MQNLTQVYSSPSYKPVVFECKQGKLNFILNINSHLNALQNYSCKNSTDEVAKSIFYDDKEKEKTSNEKELKNKLNSIIGGKYQIGDVNLEIKNSFLNVENTKGFIEFELNKNKAKTLTKEALTQGRAYFEKKSDESDVVEFKLVIDDKGCLNKKTHLIDFFKNLYKRIFGDKTKVELINTKKELIEQNIENFSKNEVKKSESIIKKLTAENNNLTEENNNLIESKKKLNTLISELKGERSELAKSVEYYQKVFNKKKILRQNRAKIQADSNKELSKLSQRMNFLFEQFNNLKKSQEKTASSLVQSLIETLSSNETLSDVEIQEKLDIASSICMSAIKEECSYILNEIKNITNQLSELNNNQKPIYQTTNLLNLKADINILSTQVKEHADNTEKHIIPLLKEKIQLNIKNATLVKGLTSQALNMGKLEEAVEEKLEEAVEEMSSIKKLTAENEDLKTENKILLESQKSTETVAYTFMHENQILNNIIKNLDSQREILSERNKKLIQEITAIIENEDIQEVNEIVKCWRKSRE
ncbi:hypothetical protein [Candidatus Williamhamiltonella defendens]|uniref:hypothetical protein n=1 Tax=Candidatus Williamhamiltonella defendens TaxID=138072 RepID=UPI0002DF4C09|nr:hypothetical protein [Candidatus Hamiltonella defensa]